MKRNVSVNNCQGRRLTINRETNCKKRGTNFHWDWWCSTWHWAGDCCFLYGWFKSSYTLAFIEFHPTSSSITTDGMSTGFRLLFYRWWYLKRGWRHGGCWMLAPLVRLFLLFWLSSFGLRHFFCRCRFTIDWSPARKRCWFGVWSPPIGFGQSRGASNLLSLPWRWLNYLLNYFKRR